MAVLTAKKHPLTRAAHYIFLLPFLPALQPLLVHYRMADMIIYLSGIVLVLFLVIYGNHLPLLKTDSSGLNLFLHYRHNAEYHPFTGLENYRRSGSSRISLYSVDYRPVVLKMKKKDVEKLISILEEENIHAIEK
ncbi:MAG: hypothetical protein DRP70_06725 [Spirochaetes bacterium]|nr:MAG: hypothetical protein DRP49_09160 [Spirochaetota bacterium]RKX76424.1 MAG: hypothetical protein DRP60_07595 [Spirochaetota bacterium]RKX88355.1 MAG: hypothetical protein DRP70_06725 [Spirochaetota bacterium]RKX97892.1 MAG: hypothetical protein DRZ90_04770 [Spirochaetota bacterium]